MTSARRANPGSRALVEFRAHSFPRLPWIKPPISATSRLPNPKRPAKVAEVFHSVAAKYDIMNDLMSAGLHRLWKRFAVAQAGLRPGMRVLDVAGGTADLTRLFLKEVGAAGTVLTHATSTSPCCAKAATAC